MVSRGRAINNPIPSSCFPLDIASMWMIPISNGILILDARLQLDPIKANKASPIIILY